MKIDPQNGAITLDDGWSFQPQYPRHQLSTEPHERVVMERERTPYFSYLVYGGSHAGTVLTLQFHFEDQTLFRVELVDEPQQATPENFCESEAKRQEFFLAVLKDSLGKPHQERRSPNGCTEWPILSRYLSWSFAWGEAWCGTHPKDGYVSAGIGYKSQGDADMRRGWRLLQWFGL